MKRIVLIVAAGLLAAGAVQAQEDASSMSELLRQIEQGQARDSAEARQREAEFAQRRNEQQQLLNQARAERNRQEQESERLEQLFATNQQEIVDARAALDERLGALKELFGVLQMVAGDAQGRFDASLTSVQYPDRGEFLTELGGKMASASSLASIEDIERLWFELQREVVESGNVVRFEQEFANASGERVSDEVIRVGVFNLVYDGGYLEYDSTTGNVTELQRQPEQSRYTGSTADLLEATDGTVRFGLDVTRGSILSLLVESPTITERINQGGIVGYSIIGLGIIGLLIALWRWIGLSSDSRKVSAQLKSDTANTDNPLGRVLAAYEANEKADTETIELKLSEAALKEMPRLTKGLAVHQGHFRSRAIDGTARYGYRYDQDVPGHNTLRCRRSENDGRRYLAGTDDYGAGSGRRHSNGADPYAGQWPEPQDHQHSQFAECRPRCPAFRKARLEPGSDDDLAVR
ncbi:MAG: hypothetical protein U5K38_19580 [Woeseiaceae bacterium]|nr:hypothetical protein [Woeseiaceae bacterium]